MKAAIYTRDGATRARGETSHGAQEEGCRRLAEALGFPPALAEDVLSDQGSGAGLERPGFLELGRRIDDGVYDAVVVHSRDRVARDSKVLMEFLRRCEEAGVGVYFVEG